MSARRSSSAVRLTTPAVPQFQVRARRLPTGDLEAEVWQLPAPASPHVRHPLRIAGLGGRNLGLVEARVLRRLREAGLEVSDLALEERAVASVDEQTALQLGLLFRVLAPMHKRENMKAVAQGIEAMSREEAAYWLGMAMHRKYPRRVLMSLRFLLIDPHGGR
jgi:hypothetical protein